MLIRFYDADYIPETKPQYAVIAARYKNKWLLVRHKERTTWEIPGGHCEEGESIDDAAQRELYEETGAVQFRITPVCYYSVTIDNETNFGRLYFSEIEKTTGLADYEIGEMKLFDSLPENLTYPSIQPVLFKKVIEFIKE